MEFLKFKLMLLCVYSTFTSYVCADLDIKASEQNGELNVELLSDSKYPIVIALSSRHINYKSEIRYRKKGGSKDEVKVIERGQNIWPSFVGRYGLLFLDPKKSRTVGPVKGLNMSYLLPDKNVDLKKIKG